MREVRADCQAQEFLASGKESVRTDSYARWRPIRKSRERQHRDLRRRSGRRIDDSPAATVDAGELRQLDAAAVTGIPWRVVPSVSVTPFAFTRVAVKSAPISPALAYTWMHRQKPDTRPRRSRSRLDGRCRWAATSKMPKIARLLITQTRQGGVGAGHWAARWQ